MVFLLLSIICSAGALLTLKLATSRGMNIPTVNFLYRIGMGSSAILTLVLRFSWKDVPGLFEVTWPYILPGIGFLYLTGVASMNTLSRGHIGVSTMVTRSSIILPVGFVLWTLHSTNLLEFQRLLPFALAGCFSILLGFASFGFENSSRSHSDSVGSWLAWLAASFFALGGWDIVVAASSSLDETQTLFCYCITSLGAALLSSFRAKMRIGKDQRFLVLVPLTAGLLALLLAVVRPLAVKEMGGLIVFPAFAIGVTILVQICGALFWKQRIGRFGVGGMIFASIGITILAYCRY